MHSLHASTEDNRDKLFRKQGTLRLDRLLEGSKGLERKAALKRSQHRSSRKVAFSASSDMNCEVSQTAFFDNYRSSLPRGRLVVIQRECIEGEELLLPSDPMTIALSVSGLLRTG